MRFLLYNLRYCAGTARNFHFPVPGKGYLKRTANILKQVTQFIGSQAPDIVGLVEVDSGSYRSRQLNQAEEIARALGHFHAYQSKYPSHSRLHLLPLAGKQGNAFLTREEIQAQQFHYFERGVKRLVIELELKNLVIFLVHLSLRRRTRQAQLQALLPLVQAVDKPRIVAGDFNSFGGAEEIQPLLDAAGLRNAAGKTVLTHPSWAPRRQLDYILHSPEIAVTRFYVPQVLFSDHLPLVCDFTVPATSAARLESRRAT
ncbi:MAG: endonuclease/exonuclease/phosphatase family protein [Verrucomicrobia bacterium]|nr:endonuclease/exonuclease/phosphatase family protein [Verrucomicrobiota bacterium]